VIEVLLGSVASCFSLGFAIIATKRGINLKDFSVEKKGNIDLKDYFGLEGESAGFENIMDTAKVSSNAAGVELKNTG